jgi:hypothetical protein
MGFLKNFMASMAAPEKRVNRISAAIVDACKPGMSIAEQWAVLKAVPDPYGSIKGHFISLDMKSSFNDRPSSPSDEVHSYLIAMETYM